MEERLGVERGFVFPATDLFHSQAGRRRDWARDRGAGWSALDWREESPLVLPRVTDILFSLET
jgi:hypothetical protein